MRTPRYDANTFARAWLSVALASGKDKGRPALNRTVSIETYDEGVRLVATDGLVLLHSFVPTIDEDIAIPPDLDAVPDRVATAIDHYGRALSLMAHLNTITAGEDEEDVQRAQVEIVFDVEAPEHVGQLDGMESACIALDHPDHERVVLSTYDGDYPNWRALVHGFTGRRTEAVALNPEIVARIARLGKYHTNGRPLLWRWGGVKKPAGIEVADGEPFVGGLVMPMLIPALEGERLRETEDE